MRSAYFPSISFKGEGGEGRAYAQQDLLPGVYFGPAEVWKVQVGLRWTLFDGLAREARVAEAHAEEQRARADAQQMRNLVELQIWTAFIDLRTALKQRDAATASLHAAEVSYDATVDSLKAGLSTTLDLVSAQRNLAPDGLLVLPCFRLRSLVVVTRLRSMCSAPSFRDGYWPCL